MKSDFRNRHKPLVTALKRAGYKVDDVAQQEKRTVITVTAPAQSAMDEPKRDAPGV
jgi:hypothetical protein